MRVTAVFFKITNNQYFNAAAKALNKISSATRKALQDIGMEIKWVKDYFVVRLGKTPVFKGNEAEIEYFWNKILKSRIRTGTGGSLKYLRILSRNVLEQEHSMSCAAACIRQIAEDSGLVMTEKEIRTLLDTSVETGTTDLSIKLVLEEIFKDSKVEALSYFRHSEDVMPNIVTEISKEGSWIGNIHPYDGNKHAIIIDKVVGNKVYIRDPWPIEGIGKGTGGVEATISEKEFGVLWAQGGNYGYKIKK